MDKQLRLNNDILLMISNFCTIGMRDKNHNKFLTDVSENWKLYAARPRLASLSNVSITVVWTNEMRTKYYRADGRRVY